ncbi:hypothetical protein pEaSNUABM8_00005 [Erwinia phage pEa_SNUABM_8]|nr:hypothetical protein pEaSNUABM8_00005 [Erwinia phage pEa_SNUABM_8]QVW54768.1 hypothetical protein pEaSNUABM4_00004 [Erwinia phage pEa_SNUABM_4]
MNLYLLERQDDVDYDEFDSIIVAAPTEQAARAIRPSGSGWVPEDKVDDGEFLRVVMIGTTDRGEGIVHESFCAG